MPKVPKNADEINVDNGFHQLPPSRLDFKRPWFIYDYEDPAPKFRWVDTNHTSREDGYISEGRDEATLDDTRRAGMKPVYVGVYQ
jgi:hypothetical protein